MKKLIGLTAFLISTCVVGSSCGSGITSNLQALGFFGESDETNETDETDGLTDYGHVRGVADSGLTVVDVTSYAMAYKNGFSHTGVIILESKYTDEFRWGDKIVSVDGTEIKQSSELELLLEGYSVGDEIGITILRNGQTLKISLVLKEKVPSSVDFDE